VVRTPFMVVLATLNTKFPISPKGTVTQF
jgi:hypothetical protein